MSSLRLALRRSSEEAKGSSPAPPTRYGAQPAPKRSPLITVESLVAKRLLSEWHGPHNDVCEACEVGGSLLECSFCNVCFHNTLECLGSSMLSEVSARPAVDGFAAHAQRSCPLRRRSALSSSLFPNPRNSSSLLLTHRRTPRRTVTGRVLPAGATPVRRPW